MSERRRTSLRRDAFSRFHRSTCLFVASLCLPFVASGCKPREARWQYGPLVDAPAEAATSPDGVLVEPERVERALSEYGCTACHTFHGERLVGPPLAGLRDRTRRFADGTERVVDAAYLVDSLYAPGRQVVEGYPDAMPSYEGVLDEAMAERIAAYLLALR